MILPLRHGRGVLRATNDPHEIENPGGNTVKLYTSIGPNPRVVKMFMAEKGIDLDRIDGWAGIGGKGPIDSISLVRDL